ncbi:DUF418 domain-containing protein [Staphylococcus kloosii]|jgi:uncharacterized protein|uniref:DUF418 domain-containing protein n=1 Tax=Staphylococcus kloosii TaxID=29384 RepID=UPI00189EF893|nr:DUF418 domain-containing protein [Staphylococcus kloosii]MBF7025239.1 DUF418 domain-containing protein [Staphylococcus kloosii]
MSDKSKRISELDYMRGFALLGIILTNIITLYKFPTPSNFDQVKYLQFIDFFVEDKFFTIFSFLFGVGFYIFIRNLKQKDLNSNFVFLRRLAILAVFGLLHQLLQPGEALLLYAIFGLILIPCFYLNKYINLVLGLIILCICLYLGNKTILPIPYFLLGLAAGQFCLFENIKTKLLIILTTVSGLISIACWIILSKAYVFPSYKLAGYTLKDHDLTTYTQQLDFYNHLIVITSPFIALFYVSALLLVVKTKLFGNALAPLSFYGRMALTNYIGQTLLIWAVMLMFNKHQVNITDTLFICVIIYILQLIASTIWLKFFKYGPLEYIWRVGTYMKLFNNKKPKTQTNYQYRISDSY